MTDKHSIIAPSKSERWLACPGSARLETRYPESTSEHAALGLDAHRVFEKCLTPNAQGMFHSPISFINAEVLREDGSIFKVTEEMAYYLLPMVDWCMEQRHRLKGVINAEKRVTLPFIHPELSGTVDCSVVQAFGEVIIFDLKYGRGDKVSPIHNSQLKIYALGAIGMTRPFEKVTLAIGQPRVSEEVQTFEILPKLLREWGEEVLKPGADKAFKGSKKFVAGEHCRFCLAATDCPKLKEQALTIAGEVFSDSAAILPEPARLQPAEIVKILRGLPVFDLWRKAIDNRAVELAARNELPGYKLVNKVGNRKWTDPVKAAQELEAKLGIGIYTPPALKSPAQVEKLCKGTDILVDKYTERSVSGVALVKDDDPRHAINSLQYAMKIFKEE